MIIRGKLIIYRKWPWPTLVYIFELKINVHAQDIVQEGRTNIFNKKWHVEIVRAGSLA